MYSYYDMELAQKYFKIDSKSFESQIRIIEYMLDRNKSISKKDIHDLIEVLKYSSQLFVDKKSKYKK